MDIESVIALLKSIGAKNVRKSGEWVNCSCPLAPWTHSKKRDRHPSFGVLSDPSGVSLYRCFSCTPKARRLEHLVFRLWLYKQDVTTASKILAEKEIWDENQEEAVPTFKDTWVEDVPDIKLPETVLRIIPRLDDTARFITNEKERSDAIEYLSVRGISEKVAVNYGVRLFPGVETLVFPFTTVSGEIKVLRARKLYSKTFTVLNEATTGVPGPFPKIYATGVWFGLAQIDWTKPVILVEGELDALRLITLGKRNVIASGGVSVVDRQIQSLLGTAYILGFDSDEEGEKCTRRVARALRGKAVLYKANWEEFAKVKDPGDLPNKDAMKEVFHNLEDVDK